MKRFLAAVAVALFWADWSFAQSAPTLPVKEKFHLFLLAGQSNMAGRGAVERQDQTPHARVLTLSKEGKWLSAVDPLHFDKPVAGVGLGKTFAQVLADADPDVTIGLVPCAVGGSPIDSWQPGAYYAATKSHPWDDAARRIQLARESGVWKGILWHQGESDSTPALAPAYEAKLIDLVARLRTELKDPNVPFILGQMGQFPDSPWDEPRQLVDQAHRRLATRVQGVSFVGAEGLKHKGDKVHFDAASYREFGKRYAAAYLKLVSP